MVGVIHGGGIPHDIYVDSTNIHGGGDFFTQQLLPVRHWKWNAYALEESKRL